MGVFHERLKELKDNCGETQLKIAESLGVTPQAFSYYIKGREPNYELLVKISQYFKVTTDYLLGISNSKSGADDSILKSTGLNDKSIQILSRLVSQNTISAKTLNDLIQQPQFETLADEIQRLATDYYHKNMLWDDDQSEDEREKLSQALIDRHESEMMVLLRDLVRAIKELP